MGLLPHASSLSLPLFIMSLHQDPYHCPGPSQTNDESDSETHVTRQVLRSPGESWPLAVATGDISGYPQHERGGNLSEASQVVTANLHSFHHHFGNPVNHPPFSDLQGMNYAFNYPDFSQPVASTSSQHLGAGVDATYIDANPFVDPSYYYAEFDQLQYPDHCIPYNYDFQPQPLAHYAHQPPVQGDHTQVSHVPVTPVNPPSSWAQPSSLSLVEPVYQADRLSSDSLVLHGPNTAMMDPIAGQYTRHSPVATSSNQMLTSSTSHLFPSSPDHERKRPSTTDESPKLRRVVPRHTEASSMHSPDSLRRRRSDSEVHGRGISIPQERYRTSTISSYNTPQRAPIITFNLESPDQIGIPIIDILNKTGGFARICDRTEGFDMEKKTFTLRIRWPGYKPWSKTIAALDWKKSRAPVTRVKLAEAVATAIRDLFEKYRDERYDPEYARWNVGPDGIRLDQVCLVALYQVSRGSWQPQLCMLGSQH